MGVLRPTGFATFRRKGLDAAAGLLIHGSDRGGVHERAGLIAADIAAKSGDAFAVMRLDGSDLSADPGKLADEIQSLSLLGGRRVIWVENAGEALAKAIAPFAEAGPIGNFVVAEAGSLPKTSKLRTLFEGAERLWSLPCYEDSEQDLDQLIDEELAQAGLEINSDAREALASLLGADRQLSRQELRKLVTYCHGKKQVELADIEAICGDVTGFGIDDAVHAAFGGDLAAASAFFRRLVADGSAASSLLSVALTHSSRLMHFRAEMDRGKTAQAVIAAARPAVFFKAKETLARELSLWNEESLMAASQLLSRASLETRKYAALQDQIAERAFLSIARMALQQRRAA
jgi:DNA polymerase-3 subunit delta